MRVLIKQRRKPDGNKSVSAPEGAVPAQASQGVLKSIDAQRIRINATQDKSFITNAGLDSQAAFFVLSVEVNQQQIPVDLSNDELSEIFSNYDKALIEISVKMPDGEKIITLPDVVNKNLSIFLNKLMLTDKVSYSSLDFIPELIYGKKEMPSIFDLLPLECTSASISPEVGELSYITTTDGQSQNFVMYVDNDLYLSIFNSRLCIAKLPEWMTALGSNLAIRVMTLLNEKNYNKEFLFRFNRVVSSGTIDEIKQIIDSHGSDFLIGSSEPLISAIRSLQENRSERVAVLLKHGADPLLNIPKRWSRYPELGCTIIQYAAGFCFQYDLANEMRAHVLAKSQHGDQEKIQAIMGLVDFGLVDVDGDFDSWTTEQLSSIHEQMKEYPCFHEYSYMKEVDNVYDVRMKKWSDKTCETTRDRKTRQELRRLAIECAAKDNHPLVVEFLLMQETVPLQHSKLVSPLIPEAIFRHNYDMTATLIKYCYDVNQLKIQSISARRVKPVKVIDGAWFLYCAVEAEDLAIVSLLLENGCQLKNKIADPNHDEIGGYSIWMNAKNNEEILQLLNAWVEARAFSSVLNEQPNDPAEPIHAQNLSPEVVSRIISNIGLFSNRGVEKIIENALERKERMSMGGSVANPIQSSIIHDQFNGMEISL